MKSYLSLIPISAKVHRRQNRMTLLCIVFAVFMVTAVFSMAEMGFRMEQARLVGKHGSFSIGDLLGSSMGQTLLSVAVVLFLLILIAAILSMIFPAVYVAVATWHTSLLPTKLVLSMAEARQGVPFPALGEILLMEISFELLKEAGIRLPGPMGNTIGIVGGLIIGQAAVDASLVSPIVVIVVAFTALCSFAIPNEEFASAFRILKYGCIFMGAWLGLYGVALSGLWVLIHLSHLNSFGIPYLMPYVAADVNGYEDKKDSLFRFPLKYCVRRPIFARRGERIKLRKRD